MVVGFNSSLSGMYPAAFDQRFRGASGRTGGLNESPWMQKEQDEESGLQKSRRMRNLIRELTDTSQQDQYRNMYASSSESRTVFDSRTGLTSKEDEKEQELPKVTKYNYKEVANKIQSAKTSVSAAQAVISAKRKVAEVKRKISEGDGDPEELQSALTHAKRMEMAARKKKHNLEIEELAERTRKFDEDMDKLKESAGEMKQAMVFMSEAEKEEQEDEVFDARHEMVGELSEQIEEGAKISEEELADINSMIAEFGDDMLEELEKEMEQLEDMEIVDPHMSREELEKLKVKHRGDEQKAIVKADMDYLKDVIARTSAPLINTAL